MADHHSTFNIWLVRDTVPDDLTREQYAACVEALEGMATDEGWDIASRCYAEWLRRIGGLRNLRAYADCLIAGRRHKAIR